MVYLVQIINFVATSWLLAHWSTLDTVAGGLSAASGIFNVYAGPQVYPTNSDKAYIAIVWDPEFENPTNQFFYTAFAAALAPISVGGVNSYFVEYRVEPYTAFTSPETEVTLAQLKTGKTESDLEEVLEDMAAVFGDVAGAYAPFSWGNLVGNANYSIIAGWDSITAHFTAAGNPPLNALIPDLVATIATTFVHVDFEVII